MGRSVDVVIWLKIVLPLGCGQEIALEWGYFNKIHYYYYYLECYLSLRYNLLVCYFFIHYTCIIESSFIIKCFRMVLVIDECLLLLLLLLLLLAVVVVVVVKW